MILVFIINTSCITCVIHNKKQKARCQCNTYVIHLSEQHLKLFPALPVTDIETVKILKKVALSALNQVIRLLTNQYLLFNPRLESKSNSEIENIATTTDTLFMHESGSSTAYPQSIFAAGLSINKSTFARSQERT
ncbi:Fic/DOC family N-terminal domain-containing protein [Vibrio cyclitrophicus]